jgi:hypothetical protein
MYIQSIDISPYNPQTDQMDRDKKIDLQTLPYILITNFYGHIVSLTSISHPHSKTKTFDVWWYFTCLWKPTMEGGETMDDVALFVLQVRIVIDK